MHYEHLSDDAFYALRDLLLRDSGIYLADRCRPLVIQRLRKRLDVTGKHGFWDYYQHVVSLDPDHPERIAMVNALTTNRTAFFREDVHFRDLKDKVIPTIVGTGGTSGVLRVWCSACSTGEEAWSLAMLIDDALRLYPGWKAEIDATDINTDVLKRAQAGIYPNEAIETVPEEYRRRHFLKGFGRWSGHVRIASGLKEMVRFSHFNLSSDNWGFSGKYHVVFCRNLLIYFDPCMQRRVLEGIRSVLTTPGWLALGLTESTPIIREFFHAEMGSLLLHEGRRPSEKVRSTLTRCP